MAGRQNEDAELAIAAYQSARDELLERIRLRDQNLFAYLAAIGAILGIVFKDSTTVPTDIHLVAAAALPLICLIFSAIILNHHVVIGKIGEYIVTELSPAASLVCWDTSRTRNQSSNNQAPRAISQGLLLTLPMLYSAWFMIRIWNIGGDNGGYRALVLGIVFLNVSLFLLIACMNISAFRRRKGSEAERIPHISS